MKKLMLVIGALAAVTAGAEWVKDEIAGGETSGEMRGFGRVTWSKNVWREGASGISDMSFKVASAKNAEAVIGKFIYDLEQSSGVTKRKAGDVTLFVSEGGNAFAFFKTAISARILSCGNVADLERYVTAQRDALGEDASDAKAPEFMKRFRWGTYGMGGLENFHGWMDKAGAKKNELLDPRDDMAFLKEMGNMRFDNWLQPHKDDKASGIIDANGVYWKRKLAEDMGIQYSYRLYMPLNGYEWPMRRFSEYLEQPAEWMNTAWLRANGAHQPHFSWHAKEIWEFFANETRKFMLAMKTDKVQGWMNPVGEVAHQTWYDIHDDFSAIAKTSWHDWLTEKGVSLADLSEMYRRADDPFQTMEQVPIPEFAMFSGLPGMVMDLEGTWWTRGELLDSPATAAWWKQSLEDRYPGIKEKWYEQSVNETDWQSLKMPGNIDFHDLYNGKNGERANANFCTRWFARSFDWAKASANGKKVYFYFFPMSNGRIHSPGTLKEEGKLVNRTRYHKLYINGKFVSDMGSWCGIDVTDILKEGANKISIQLHGNLWAGRVFLSTEPPAEYPHLGEKRNQLFEMWGQWRTQRKDEACCAIFDGMRQADKDAPIKMMAPIKLGQIITNKMMADWGGHAHFTGEGVWFFPWYKRYGKVYGTQGTSELAGPESTIEEMERSTLRVFLAGLDAHEPVFLTQTYSRNPEMRAWWLKHRDLLHRMGTYDIYGPQVYIYRRTALTESALPGEAYPRVGEAESLQSPWDWDVGRGSLQSFGQSYLYLDDDGIADGKMYNEKLMFDCGNGVVPAAQQEQIRAWMKEGGVYVSYPCSGFKGAKVAGKRPLGGTVTFEKNTPYFAAYAGKSFKDEGKVVNCNGGNLNEFSLELEAGENDVVVARYENGKPAIIVSRVGKGLHVTLGSLFWRDVADIMGIWWPGECETKFLKELVATVGAPEAVCGTSDPLVWAQPYRSNNGMDAVACLCNFNAAETTQRVSVTMKLKANPRAMTRYWEGGTAKTDFEWDEATKTAKATFDIPGNEVCVLNAESYDATSAVDYWWKENQISWREVKKGTLNLKKYDEGKWKHPTQDLKLNAFFTETEPNGDAWLKEGFKATDWKPCVIDTLQFWGAKDGAKAWARKEFDLENAKWLEGGATKFITGSFVGRNFIAKGRVFLNGVEIAGKNQHRYLEIDVTKILKAKGNVLAFEFEPDEKFTGLTGAVYLYHRDYAERSLSLEGVWKTKDGKDFVLPGKGTVVDATRKVFIPSEWKGKYKVILYMEGPNNVPLGVRINDKGRFMRKHHHNFGNVTDIDITNFLKFGEENVLVLGHDPNPTGKASSWNISAARLDLFEIR